MSYSHHAIALALVAGCAGNQGTQPHDMSQAEHQHAAQEEATEAEQHAAMPDEQKQTCSPGPAGNVCWTTGPDHEAMAKRHQKLASKHRAASEALAQAEAEKCAGIPEADRDMSPFAHKADISSVEVLTRSAGLGAEYVGPEPDEVVGATVTFRAVPGMTKEWLQRTMDCHSARNASMGFQMEGMEYCPLMVKGSKAAVRSTRGGFAVDITAEDDTAVDEIVARAKTLR